MAAPVDVRVHAAIDSVLAELQKQELREVLCAFVSGRDVWQADTIVQSATSFLLKAPPLPERFLLVPSQMDNV